MIVGCSVDGGRLKLLIIICKEGRKLQKFRGATNVVRAPLQMKSNLFEVVSHDFNFDQHS